MLRTSATFALLALVVSCGPNKPGVGDDDDDGSNGPHVLSAVVISPLNPIVQLDLNTTGTQAFTLTGEYEDNTTADLTAMATWTLDNPDVGTLTGPTLAIPAFTAVSAKVSKIHASVTTSDGTFMGVAQITVVAYRMTGTQTDFFFTLPYGDPPQTKPLDFSTNIPALDVLPVIDTTGSMGGEISDITSAFSTPTTGIVATVQTSVANTEFGAAEFRDFPTSDYGSPGDEPFTLHVGMTTDTTAVQNALNTFAAGGGNDGPEAGLEAVWEAAQNMGNPNYGGVQYGSAYTIGWRMGTMPVIVGVSDIISHEWDGEPSCGTTDYSGITGVHGSADVVNALSAMCAKYVGMAAIYDDSETCDARGYMRYLATQSGARVPPAAWDVGTRPTGCAETECCTGLDGVGSATDADGLCPLVFDVSTTGTGVSAGISTGISMLTRFAEFSVPTSTSGVTTDITGSDMLPSPHTTADFIKSIPPVAGSAGYTLPPAPPVVPAPTVDANNIQFDGVTPGTKVVFSVNAQNDFLMQTDDAQIFEATISVTASGCQVLDQRTVLILVPPNAIVIQ